MESIKIASRKSILAIAQTDIVINLLKDVYPDLNFEIVTIDTKGDKNLDTQLSQIGSKGLFTFEIEQLLLDNSVDMAVHSLKDMPTEFERGLSIGAYIKRHSPKDIIIFSKNYKDIQDLPPNAKIGTSSLRRQAQLKRINEHFEVCSIRGNIHTRLKKMKEQNFDAIILAKAGLERLDMLKDVCYQELDFIPASAQGCICVQINSKNEYIKSMLESINDEDTKSCVCAERDFLHSLGGSCQTPIGAYCEKIDDLYYLEGFVSNLDAKEFIYDKISLKNADMIGKTLSQILISKGADKLLIS